MLDCHEAGLLRPSAKEVAERAGVSTRAVFRHFENMEALLEAAAELQIERITRELPPVLTTGPIEERIDALVAQSARRNEAIAPVRRAALLSEPFSKVIRDRHRSARRHVRRQIRRIFAEEWARFSETERDRRISTIRALLSFGCWDELRRHERLPVSTARQVLGATIRAQFPEVRDDSRLTSGIR